jgi:hypothetical protein
MEVPSADGTPGAEAKIHTGLVTAIARIRALSQKLDGFVSVPTPTGASSFDGKAVAQYVVSALERMEQALKGAEDVTNKRIMWILGINRTAAFLLSQKMTDHRLALPHQLRAEAVFFPSLAYPEDHARWSQALDLKGRDLGSGPDLSAVVQGQLAGLQTVWQEWVREDGTGLSEDEREDKATAMARAILNTGLLFEILHARCVQQMQHAWAREWLQASANLGTGLGTGR